MDKIIITGVAGFLGSNLANHLLNDEKNFIYGLDNFSSSTMSNLYPLLKNDRFEFIEHNLVEDINLEADYVYHLAGNGDLSLYYDNKYDFILNKIEIIKNIVTFCQNKGARLLLTTQNLNYQEHNKKLFKYFDTLKLIENLILELVENNKLNAIVARIDYVYGENMLKNDNRFIAKHLIDILNNNDIELDFDESYYFTYVKDIISNFEKLMKTYSKDTIVDVYSDNLYLKSDIIKLMIAFSKSSSKLTLKSAVQFNPNYTKPKQTDYTCPTAVLDGVLNMINYFKLMYFS